MESLTQNPWAQYDDKPDFEIPSASYQIYNYVSSLAKEESKNVFRASSASMCVRRRQYQKAGVDGIPITPRKILNFMSGDIAEMVMKYFISQACVGDGKLYSEVYFGEPEGSVVINGKMIATYHQPTYSFELPNKRRITAHPDGRGKRNLDGQWELIEVKSAADWGFQDFKVSGPGDYLKQAHAVMLTDEMTALNARSVRFFYFRKMTGNIWDRVFNFDPELAKRVVEDFLLSDSVELAKPYELVDETRSVRNPEDKRKWIKIPTGRKKAPFPCGGYCPYTKNCHGEYKLEWSSDRNGQMKPVYIFKR